MASRILFSTRRSVQADDRERYDETWSRLAELGQRQGFNAWRFASAAEPSRIIEFVEFKSDRDPRASAEYHDILGALDGFGGETPEEWQSIDDSSS